MSNKKVTPLRINVFYWASFSAYDDTQKYQHGDEFEYSKKKRNSIIDYFLDRGYAVMLKQFGDGDTLTISVDTQKFGQR